MTRDILKEIRQIEDECDHIRSTFEICDNCLEKIQKLEELNEDQGAL